MSRPTLHLDPLPAQPQLLLGGSHHDRHQVSAFTLLHRMLRGKYLLAGVLGTLGGVGGGVAGYLSQKPVYRCEGQVQVKTPPVVLRQTPENQAPGERYVNTQAAFIASDRVVAAAMNSQGWRDTGRGRLPEVQKQFRDSLQVVANRDNAELIRVTFTDRDPAVARVAVDEVLDAYDRIWVKGAQSNDEEFKINTLETERKKLEADMQNVQAQIQGLAAEHGTDDLSVLLEFHLNQQIQREMDVTEFRRQVALREAGPKMPAPGEGDGGRDSGATSLTPEQIAVLDPHMRELLDQRDAVDSAINAALQNVREEHRSVKQLRNQRAALDKTIEQQTARFVEGRTVQRPDIPDQARVMTLEQLKTALATAEHMLDDWRAKTVQLGNTKLKLDELRRRKAQLQTDIQGIDERRKELRMQAGARGDDSQVIRIYKPSETPSLPAADKRVRMAAFGAVGGAGFPVALVALWGFWGYSRRFTYSDEARERGHSATLLGILPQLPRDLSDPEQTAAAAHCVHQMRTLLQIGGESRKVYAITSSTAGDGKTSLALSLGMSFAASGTRTLLIDFDLIGHGLSSALKCRTEHGLGAVLASGAMNGSVVPTGIERLSLLPAGRDDDRFVSKLSRVMVREMIERAREAYDVVIVDTGPILGSLEANFVTAEADGVVLVVGRGQQRSYVDRAFEQLHAVGARVTGMVFNRASSTDFMRSATSTSFRSVRPDPVQPMDMTNAPDYEPVARTVALDIRR